MPPAGPGSGEVLFGINTIYTVLVDGERVQCRIKGKQLKEKSRSYNPIAPGDMVTVVRDAVHASHGMIHALAPRRTRLARWNKKGRAPQVLAANADIAVCVTCPSSPPFRPRFIDRLIVAAETGGLSPWIVLNKCDLGCPEDVEERLQRYADMGYEVRRCSARTGEGVAGLAAGLHGATTVLVGQSGVGKSSLINALCPGLDLRIGALSAKYDRGNHTTIVSVLHEAPNGMRIIDTPGVRELEIADVLPEEIGYHFREIAGLMGGCSYQPCLHADEPGCAVAAGVESGTVHPDRYESYLRILEELREARRPGNG
jgi:ribosome biogenesis GTPase / thiamine phosphate phosphatase